MKDLNKGKEAAELRPMKKRKVGRPLAKPPILVDDNQPARFRAIRELDATIKSMNIFKDALADINTKLKQDCKGVDEVSTYLLDKTGFANLEMAADAMGLKAEYKVLASLSQDKADEVLVSLNEAGEYVQSDDAINIIREIYSTYVHKDWYDEAAKILEFKEWYEGLDYNVSRAITLRDNKIQLFLHRLAVSRKAANQFG